MCNLNICHCHFLMGILSSSIEFWNVFRSRVHANSSLSAIDKFGYLKEKLQGSAARAIEVLDFCDSCYKQAVDILLQIFGRKFPLVNTHLTALLALSSSDNLSEVTNLSQDQLTTYDHYFDNLSALSIIEDCSSSVDNTYYIPHHGVGKHGKLRVVYDRSFGNPSFNQLLQTGPNLSQIIQ